MRKAIKKTSRMLQAEEMLAEPLETALPRLLEEEGYLRTAVRLGVSTTTLQAWGLALGIRVRADKHPGHTTLMEKVERKVGKRIEEILSSPKSDRALAKELGVTQGTIWRWRITLGLVRPGGKNGDRV